MEQKALVDTVPIEQLIHKLGAEAVFGAPHTEKGETIIPVAQVEFGFGYGSGYGQSQGDDEDEDEEATPEAAPEAAQKAGEGGGGGGGAGGRVTPRGYIRISAEGVKYEPIMDETRIPLAGILMGAWTIFWIAMTIRTLVKAVASVQRAKPR
jgi:uncharacterized spore protein YtfJ